MEMDSDARGRRAHRAWGQLVPNTRQSVRDPGTLFVAFTKGTVLPNILHSEKDKGFAREYFQVGCHTGIYERLDPDYLAGCMEGRKMASSAFKILQREGAERNDRSVENPGRASTSPV